VTLGSEIGLSSSEIHVGMIADVSTAVAPGLFQKNVNVVKAWASLVNASGALAGRKMVVDFCDGKLDANATTNCVIQACQKDFALVGTAANVLNDLSDLDGCKNAAGVNLGLPNLKKDGEGFYTSSGTAPQSALTPIVQVLKLDQSTFGYGGATTPNAVLLRKEAQLQGVNSVKVWACNSGCYDAGFITQGGSAVNDEYAATQYLPFYSDWQANAALKSLVNAVGGVNNIDGNSLMSYVDALLFQDAVTKAVAKGWTLDRQTLFDALSTETAFDADGIIGPTNIAARTPSACIAVSQVQNGQWKQVYPAKAGTFNCDPANLATVKLNLAQ
jgi:hypothetical protein